MKKILAIALSAMMIFVLAACGASETKYVAQSVTMYGIDLPMDQLGTTGETYVILRNDGTCELAVDGSTESVTYSMSGSAITFEGLSQGSFSGNLDGKKLTRTINYQNIDMTINYEAE